MQRSWIASSGVAWNPIELAPQEQVERIQLAKLRDQLHYLLDRSPFYAEKLRDAPAPEDIGSLAEMAALPFTEKDELRESLAAVGGLGHHGAADPASLVQIQASSGTTGRPSYVGLTQRDLEVWTEMQARVFFAGGARPGDICLHAYSMSKGFIGGLPMVQSEIFFGMTPLPIGAEAGVDRLLAVARDQHATVALGTPYFMIYLGEQAEERLGVPAHEFDIRRILVGGEPGGGIPVVRERLEELWGATVAEAFGGTDAGLGYWGECHVGDGMHFLAPDFIIAEIVDPETEQVLTPAPGVEGEVVYTTIDRQASPVLRFRSHDWVKVIATECPCGRSSYKLRCTGRVDDMLIVRGINVFPSAIRDVVMGLRPKTSGEFRIIADFEGHSTQRPLRIRVERGDSADAAGDADLKQEIESTLATRLSAKFDTEIVAFHSFERPGAAKVNLILRDAARIGS